MIQYFSKPSEPGPLRQLPTLREATKILRIAYPNNSIHKLPPSLTKAQNCEQLDLSHNKILTLEPIFQLRKLRIVNFSYNLISFVGRGIGKLRRLQVLDLRGNLLNGVGSIGGIFQVYRVRMGEVVFQLEGNKVFEEHGEEIEQKLAQIREQLAKQKQKLQAKPELKELEISKSIEMHKRVHSQPFEQEKSSSQIISHGSKQIPVSLIEARSQIQISLASLNQFARKFQVIMASEFKGWSEGLMGIFRKESESVKSLVEAYRNIIKSLTQQFVNPLDATSKIQIGFIQASEIQELIKDQHSVLLQSLSESHDVPMTSYKVWVQLYRELRNLAQRIRWEAWSVIHSEFRNQEIEALKLISPSKLDQSPAPRVQKLQGLLFSKTKEGEGQNTPECSQCFIKDQQIRQLRELSDLLTHQNSQLKQRMQGLTQQVERMSRDDVILGGQLRKRQEQIVSSLNQRIDSSVYQKILLEQAKGIEDLIKCERHVLVKEKAFDHTQKLADLCQTATALAKDKAVGLEREGVSQFYLQEGSTELGLSRVPYFNKNAENGSNIQKKSKRNTQNSASSTEKKRKFSSDNVHKRENSRNMSNLLSRKTTERQSSEQSPNKMKIKKTTEYSQPKQQDRSRNNVITSNFAVTETGREAQPQTQTVSSRQVLAQLIAKKNIQSNAVLNSRNRKNGEKDGTVFGNKLRKCGSREKIQTQVYPAYVPVDYHSVNLKDEEPYENYMKFHLRNSIIETLEKKGKRHSLNKSGCKETTIKMISKGKEQAKNSSRASSSRLMKSTEKLGITARQRPAQNAKSYVQILGKLRH